MAAERLAEAGLAVTVYERMPSVGRKLLIAGRGGLNLTHSEPLPRFLGRYGAARGVLAPAVEAWTPDALRAWCAGLGQDTFTGSSGRVFPTAFKATPLLRAWLQRLGRQGVQVRTGWRWTGWDGGSLHFATLDGPARVAADATILALGGASWPRLGSDGGWVGPLQAQGVAVAPLRPANCGFLHPWSAVFRERFAGAPLKRITLTFEGETVAGEAVLTRDGIEGGVIYAMSGPLRDAIGRDGSATALLDLRPDLDVAALAARLGGPGQSLANALRKAGLSPAAAGLVREVGGTGPLVQRVKALALRLVGVAGMDRAISSAGGVALAELDAGFMLRRRPGVFACGEMLDWEAPTGGYLLQGAFSTGRAAAEGALAWLALARLERAATFAAAAGFAGLGRAARPAMEVAMFNPSEIIEHMEVVGSDGQHVGTVDNLVIKLTKKDPAAQGQHHLLKMNLVGSVEGGKLKLNVPAAEAMQQEQAIS